MSTALWDGLAASVLSSAVAVGLALFVMRRTLREARALAEEQRATDAALLEEQVRSNHQLAVETHGLQSGLARELASLDAARACARILAELAHDFQVFREGFSRRDRTDPRAGLLSIGQRAAGQAPVLLFAAPSITDVAVAQHIVAAVARLDADCRRVVEAAVDYLGSSRRPDSAEAPSLTEKDRAWQRFTSVLAEAAESLLQAGIAVNAYVAGRSQAVPEDRLTVLRTDGISLLQAWSVAAGGHGNDAGPNEPSVAG